MLKKFTLLVLFIFCVHVKGQVIPLSEETEVSVLTIGPGESLNDAFGHNAFRIKDRTIGLDIIYDYGRYDFETPNFYLKFAQGKLLYEIGSNNFQPFFDYYQSQNRWVKEQVLDLNFSEKKELFNYLQNNIKPENKKYKYDFFYDNCATKIRDVLWETLGENLVFTEDHITNDYTFRQLIQKNVHWNIWGSMGMDVAIGAVVDRKAKPIEYQFLPEYVYEGIEHATISEGNTTKPLVSASSTLFNAETKELSNSFLTSPLFVFGILGMLIIVFTYRDYKRKQRSLYLDTILFLVTGLIGVFILLLWFATDHSATSTNYNVLWAFPFNLLIVVAISRSKPKLWVRKYVVFLILMLGLLGIHWITGVQEFAWSLLPIFTALLIRYVYLLKGLNTEQG